MTPWQKALDLYAITGNNDTLGADVWLHFQHGYVVATPEAFAMVRPVWSHWERSKLDDVTQTDPEGDCWYIWCLTGSLAVAASWLPCPKKWLAFARRGSPRLVSWNRLSHEITRQFRSDQGTESRPCAVSEAVRDANEDDAGTSGGCGEHQDADVSPCVATGSSVA